MSDDDLSERIRKARETHNRRTGQDRPARGQSALGKGLYLGVNLVVATMIGLGIGLAIDKAANTGPWGVLIFLALGIAAGFRNIVSAALEMNKAALKDTETQSRPTEDQPTRNRPEGSD